MAITLSCDRCGKKIRGTKHGKGRVNLSVNDSSHESWRTALSFDYCTSCIKKIEKILREMT